MRAPVRDRLGCFLILACQLAIPAIWPVQWITNQLDPAFVEYQASLLEFESKNADYEAQIENLNEIRVYVTTYGEKYHRHYHYRTRNRPIGLGDALLKEMEPCRVCRPVFLSDAPIKPDPPPPFRRSALWSFVAFVTWAALLALPIGLIQGWIALESSRRESAKPSGVSG